MRDVQRPGQDKQSLGCQDNQSQDGVRAENEVSQNCVREPDWKQERETERQESKSKAMVGQGPSVVGEGYASLPICTKESGRWASPLWTGT